jgi:hypothetical protein
MARFRKPKVFVIFDKCRRISVRSRKGSLDVYEYSERVSWTLVSVTFNYLKLLQEYLLGADERK